MTKALNFNAGPRVFKPEAYGAAATYAVGTDDTAAVQACINAAVAAKGRVHLSRVYNILTAGGVTASGSITIKGEGGSFPGDPVDSLTPVPPTGLRTSSGTAVALTLSGKGNRLVDFGVYNDVSSAPTAGAGIRFTAGSQSRMTRVTVSAFYNNVETTGVFWTFDHCHFYDAANYSLFQHASSSSFYDHGDFGIIDCVFAQNYKTWGANAGIRWEAGGGIRIVGNKFLGGAAVGNANAGGGSGGNHFLICIDVMAADGVNTGDLIITGNSISNFNTCAIHIGVQNAGGTAGSFCNSTITGNLINVGFGSACAAIFGSASPSLVYNVRSIVFSGNEIDNIPGGGIKAHCLIGLCIGPNTWSGISGGPIITLADSPDLGHSTMGVDVAVQTLGPAGSAFPMNGIVIVQDNRAPGNNQDGPVTLDYTRAVDISTNGVWTSMFEIDFPAGARGGVLTVEFDGTNANAANNSFATGPVVVKQERAVTNPTSGGTTALTTIGTDVAAGAGTGSATGAGGANVAIQYVTTTANSVLVQIQSTSSSFPRLAGMFRATWRGPLYQYKKS